MSQARDCGRTHCGRTHYKWSLSSLPPCSPSALCPVCSLSSFPLHHPPPPIDITSLPRAFVISLQDHFFCQIISLAPRKHPLPTAPELTCTTCLGYTSLPGDLCCFPDLTVWDNNKALRHGTKRHSRSGYNPLPASSIASLPVCSPSTRAAPCDAIPLTACKGRPPLPWWTVTLVVPRERCLQYLCQFIASSPMDSGLGHVSGFGQ